MHTLTYSIASSHLSIENKEKSRTQIDGVVFVWCAHFARIWIDQEWVRDRQRGGESVWGFLWKSNGYGSRIVGKRPFNRNKEKNYYMTIKHQKQTNCFVLLANCLIVWPAHSMWLLFLNLNSNSLVPATRDKGRENDQEFAFGISIKQRWIGFVFASLIAFDTEWHTHTHTHSS